MNDMLQLSFEKLESLDMNKSNLSSFVLIRNSIINILSKNKNQDVIMEDRVVEDEQVWLDNCIQELQQEDMDEDEDEDIPLSPPQSDNTPAFIQKDSYCEPYYTIPYF
ncbi:hypothetical protein G6F56_008328 [Rhizopus delemar]|uniref:Uncharacterized protein n=1 Tax=Rhizopus stolonifer TaxID=4846 RepID=A0A367IT11_RHIST|nr:hypothetical protein G6F56_008328 [Rhizopus delemar]RCH80834.1 hypothetical protein CU098_006582 [Rhizopus stolonifer]